MKVFIVLAAFLALTNAACKNPTVRSRSYTPSDAQVLTHIPFVAEFSLDCPDVTSLYASIDGAVVPIAKTPENVFQVNLLQSKHPLMHHNSTVKCQFDPLIQVIATL